MSLTTYCSWKWGAGTVEGKIDEIVEDGKAQVTSNKVNIKHASRVLGRRCEYMLTLTLQGNTITRNAKEGDPAIKIARKGVGVLIGP